MIDLTVPLDLRLPARTAKKFAAAGFETVGDLLYLPPRRYYHWGRLTPMHALHEGKEATILARVVSQTLVANRGRGGVRLEVVITDGYSLMGATFFAANEYKLIPIRRSLREGEEFLFSGKVGSYRGKLQLTHPEFEGAGEDTETIERNAARPIPIYPAGKGLTSWVISRSIAMLLDAIPIGSLPAILPEKLRERHGLLDFDMALRALHQPGSDEEKEQAVKSMAWIEAFALQLALQGRRHAFNDHRAPACSVENNEVLAAVHRSLPFELTPAQVDAVEQIRMHLADSKPSQLLLQADVGAGKTVVASLAMAQVVGAGHQCALLAPTEVLAEQHASSIARFFESSGITVELLTASTTAADRKVLFARLEAGEPLILIGTHALLEDTVVFRSLGLVVIDEQHRFGVAQRDRLRTAGRNGVAHQLVMTATPIPRTVAMTVFGDLDTIRMTGLPPGRTPVATYVVDAANKGWMQRLWQRVAEEIGRGGRVYVVCPRIDEGDDVVDAETGNVKTPLTSVEALSAGLARNPALAGIGIATLTGRDSSARKNEVMADFAIGRSPLLVSTTVIEVGVDVPEATLMIIMDAQQFGLSQLHQLRGRVGRSSTPSVCIAVHRNGIGEASIERLQAFEGTTDGFELAEADLKLRQEGDILGAQQSGRLSTLKFLSVLRHGQIIAEAREAAAKIIETDSTLNSLPEVLNYVRYQHGDDVQWLERS